MGSTPHVLRARRGAYPLAEQDYGAGLSPLGATKFDPEPLDREFRAQATRAASSLRPGPCKRSVRGSKGDLVVAADRSAGDVQVDRHIGVYVQGSRALGVDMVPTGDATVGPARPGIDAVARVAIDG